ncbi:MAG: hypothetical protein H6624_11730 [Bdellovibrionaceae bacterium]|nr:hypothetical protein [Bdellovibrionales bacterium]MCB9085010.1 hypothetical protein [Pseudobdellovibrionaceae bacterium]
MNADARAYCEAKTLESAMHSELWSFHDTSDKYKVFPTEFLKGQVDDEERHTEMLRRVLELEGFPAEPSENLSMQKVIYQRVLGLDLNNTREDENLFHAVHTMVERRANWIYKMYLLNGTNERFKKVIKLIVKDERRHISGHRDQLVQTDPKITALFDLDNWFFREYYPAHYGTDSLQVNPTFWDDYFSNKGLITDPKTVRPMNDIIPGPLRKPEILI